MVCFFIHICFTFAFSGFFLLKVYSKSLHVSASVVRNSRSGGFSVVVFPLACLCHTGSPCLSPSFPSPCYQCQLGIFHQPWSLLGPAPHRVFAWDLCWASSPPQHCLCLRKLQWVSVLCTPNWDVRLEMDMNYGRQNKAAKHTTPCHLSFLTSWAQHGRSVLVFWSPSLPSNEIWKIWGCFCHIILFFLMP